MNDLLLKLFTGLMLGLACVVAGVFALGALVELLVKWMIWAGVRLD